METVTDFIFLGSKITADGDCSHEIKRHSLLWRKVMTNLDRILKSRDITLPTSVHLVKAMVFPIVMYGCETWTIKKAESRRLDAFELWCWRRLLRVPWTVRRYNQSILKEIGPEYSLEGLTLKLKCQYFGLLIWRTDHWKYPDPGKDWKQEEKGMTKDDMIGWHHQLNGHEFEQALGVGEGLKSLACCSHLVVTKSRTQLSNWSELNLISRKAGTVYNGKWGRNDVFSLIQNIVEFKIIAIFQGKIRQCERIEVLCS